MYRFRRNWIAIGILAVFDTVFIIPAVTVFNQAAESWGRFEDLFDLVAAIFSSAWLLGWSIGPLLMTLVLLLMLFGREVVTGRGELVRIFIGLPLIGAAAEYRIPQMRNLRVVRPEKSSSRSWRGEHLAFDYGANSVEFGSNAGEAELALLRSHIQGTSGHAIREGDASPDELEGSWGKRVETPAPGIQDQDIIPAAPVTWSSTSVLTLVVANLVPIVGAVFFGWALSDVMVLYWAESAIIGFYNLCKLAVIDRWLALLTGTFFVAHFGAFMAVHFLFIWGIFVKGVEDPSGGDLAEVVRLFVELWPAFVALLVSHGISYFVNFIGRGEYRGRTSKDQMSEPYSRIILMHVVLIFGGGLALILGSPTPVIILVIAGKIGVDVMAHLRERAKAA